MRAGCEPPKHVVMGTVPPNPNEIFPRRGFCDHLFRARANTFAAARDNDSRLRSSERSPGVKLPMNIRSNHHGQGLLEAIIAIGIILTATIASLTLIVSSIEASRGVRERLIASNLAREGIEAVRAVRDSNWLADRDWTIGWAVPNTTVKEIATFAPDQVFPPANPNVTRWSFTQGIVDISSIDAQLFLTSTSPAQYVQQSGGCRARLGFSSSYYRNSRLHIGISCVLSSCLHCWG